MKRSINTSPRLPPRAAHARRAYRSGIDYFHNAPLPKSEIDPDTTDVSRLLEDEIALFIRYNEHLSLASQALSLTAARCFYYYLAEERLADPNLPRLQGIVRRRPRKQGRRIPLFSREAIEQIIDYAERLAARPVGSLPRLRNCSRAQRAVYIKTNIFT